MARKIDINFLFQCYDLTETIERSGVFATITNEISDESVIFLSESVAPDMDEPGLLTIQSAKRRYDYRIEGNETIRILDPTKSDLQSWQLNVGLPRPVCRAVLLHCASSFVAIMTKDVGSVGERTKSSTSGGSRDLDASPFPDDWSNYKHVLPSLVIEFQYLDDYGNEYQNTFEMPGAFTCMPHLVIGDPPRARAMLVQFGFSRAREIQL